ncbi:MAG: thiol peroxidase [Mediterranea massiliensis]|nr:thiol peroxidase [Mediterranea massiliensis]
MITFKGEPIHLSGQFIEVGSIAPDFELVKTDLTTCSLSELKGKKILLNIFPSLDTGVCAASVRRFNKMASEIPDVLILSISKDLPFAQTRFCVNEGIENLIPLSDFRSSNFGTDYGILMVDGILKGLLARAIVVINEWGKVIYTELVPEITQEPAYDNVLKAMR